MSNTEKKNLRHLVEFPFLEKCEWEVTKSWYGRFYDRNCLLHLLPQDFAAFFFLVRQNPKVFTNLRSLAHIALHHFHKDYFGECFPQTNFYQNTLSGTLQ